MSIVQTISRPGVRRFRPAAAGDAELIGRVRAGDERAFEAIFKRHHAPLLSYARHMLANRDEAEDALQQAFIKAHRALLGGAVPRELRPWLYAIVRNCCLSAIAARRDTIELDEHTASLAGLAEAVYEREDLRELLADVSRLPEDQRSALLLAELDDLSHQSIATIVGCPVSKVKALIYQARSALIADREARTASCRDIREELAVARAGELRRGPLRRHLRLCVGCRDFQEALATQQRSLAVALPVLPSAGLAAKILSHSALQVVGGAGQAGGVVGSAAVPAGAVTGGGANVGAVASAGASAASGGGGAGAVAGGGVLAKVAVGGAIVALATTGAVTTVHHLGYAHRGHLAHAHIDRAYRSPRTPGANPEMLSATAPLTLSANVSAASSGGVASGSEVAATSEASLSNPLSKSAPESAQAPTLTFALVSPPATSAVRTSTGTQGTNGHAIQPQGGASGLTATTIRHRRRLEEQQQRLRRGKQAERKRLQEQRRLARVERERKARELKEARERRERLREERRRKARELQEAKEHREQLRAERQRQARELKEARERRELEAQQKREQREAAAVTAKPSTQTTQSSTPVTTTSTTATEAPGTEATGTEGKRKHKKS